MKNLYSRFIQKSKTPTSKESVDEIINRVYDTVSSCTNEIQLANAERMIEAADRLIRSQGAIDEETSATLTSFKVILIHKRKKLREIGPL